MSNYYYVAYGYSEYNPSGIISNYSENFSDIIDWSKLCPDYNISVSCYKNDNSIFEHNGVRYRFPPHESAEYSFELKRT